MHRNRLCILAFAILIASAAALSPAPGQTPTAPVLPRPAPKTKLVTLDGKSKSLSDFKGKVVLLDFWATWCGPCRAEMPTLQKIHDSLGSTGVTVIGVSLDRDPPRQVPKFLERMGITYPNFSIDLKDPNSAKWEVTAIPALFLIDKKGNVVAQWRGVTPEADLLRAIDEATGKKSS